MKHQILITKKLTILTGDFHPSIDNEASELEEDDDDSSLDSCDEEEELSADESSSDLENTFGNDKNDIGQVIGRPMHVEHPGISAPVGSNFSAEKKAKLIAEKEKAELRLRKMEESFKKDEDLEEEEDIDDDKKKKVIRSSSLIRKRRRKSTQNNNNDGDPSLKDLSSLWSDLNDDESSDTNKPKNSPKNKRKRKNVNYEEELEDSGLEDEESEDEESEKDKNKKEKSNNNRKRERCWLCTFSTHPLAKQVSSYVSASVSSVDTFHMASQIKNEIISKFPKALGARKRDIVRHISEHTLAPNVKMAAVLRSLVNMAETLRGTMHQQDPTSGDVVVDLKSTEVYLKVLTQISSTYKMDGNKLMFNNNVEGK